MFGNIDHLAIWQISPVLVLVQMMKQVILQTEKGSFHFSRIKTLKMAEFKSMKKLPVRINIAISVTET